MEMMQVDYGYYHLSIAAMQRMIRRSGEGFAIVAYNGIFDRAKYTAMRSNMTSIKKCWKSSGLIMANIQIVPTAQVHLGAITTKICGAGGIKDRVMHSWLGAGLRPPVFLF